jgi:hypothetical protein
MDFAFDFWEKAFRVEMFRVEELKRGGSHRVLGLAFFSTFQHFNLSTLTG